MATGIPKRRINDSGRDQSRQRGGGELRLTYDGKRNASEIIASCPQIKLKAVQPPKLLDGWVNRLYFGDNLPILGALLDDPAIRGQVALVYIDPPYSTNSVFESRQQKVAYHDLVSGAEFVESLRERLILLKELLSDRGSIYVHLDQNMAFPMKIVMDEVFGVENFKNIITRKKCNTKNYTRRSYGNISDYILFYSKTDDYVWNRPVVAWTEDKGKKEYTYLEADTGRRYKKVPLHAPGVRNGETGKPWRGVPPPPGKHWQYAPSMLEEMDRRGEIFWSSNGNPRRKIYLDESSGIPVQDIWMDFKDAHNQNIDITGYPTEKNIEMLEQIISASSGPGDLVLDCFAGSGTTLAAAGNLARRWVGIDNGKEAIATIVNRLRFGSQPMGDFVTKKAPLPTDNHLELFTAKTDFQPEAATREVADSFCLYHAIGVTNPKSQESQTESVLELRDRPTKADLPKSLEKATYQILTKPSSVTKKRH